MQLPHFLEELKDETLELLHCKRDKGCWKVGFSCGEGILVVDVPDDDQGRTDTVLALRAVANAVERDPAAQLAMFGRQKPEPSPAEARTVSLPHIDPEQTSLPITSVDQSGEVLGHHPPTEPSRALSESEIEFRAPAKGRLPRDCAVIFDHGMGEGDEPLELRAGDNVLRWEDREKPEWELLAPADLPRLTDERKLKPIFAASANQGNWVYRWRGDLKAFERLQATGKKRR